MMFEVILIIELWKGLDFDILSCSCGYSYFELYFDGLIFFSIVKDMEFFVVW